MNQTEIQIEKPQPKPSKRSVMWKIAIIAVLIAGLLIPLAMVSGVIEERQGRKNDVSREIGATWGEAQTIVGPVLVIPYKIPNTIVDAKGKSITHNLTDYAYLLPKQLQVKTNLASSVRYRAIYKSVVYTSTMSGQGQFDLNDLHELRIPAQNINWGDTFVLLNVPQPKSIQAAPTFSWNGKQSEFLPGTHGTSLFTSGLYARVECKEDAPVVPFSLKLALKGSEGFSLAPIGKQNKLEITSDWQSPSFTGSISPSSRTIDKKGFSAVWEIPYFARSYAQAFIIDVSSDAEKMRQAIAASQVGVSLFEPVDFYHQSERATKYGILFLVLTFATYFLFEVITKTRLHPFQYLLIGCALCLFYLMLVAFSEFVGFGKAYIIGSVSIIGTITLYSRAILGRTRKHSQWLIAGLLTALYGYLYVLLQLEDASLLFGTIGLFLVLSIIMYVTRNIDWYNEQE